MFSLQPTKGLPILHFGCARIFLTCAPLPLKVKHLLPFTMTRPIPQSHHNPQLGLIQKQAARMMISLSHNLSMRWRLLSNLLLPATWMSTSLLMRPVLSFGHSTTRPSALTTTIPFFSSPIRATSATNQNGMSRTLAPILQSE